LITLENFISKQNLFVENDTQGKVSKSVLHIGFHSKLYEKLVTIR